MPFDVVFEDEAILVVDKPAGVYVHPAPGHETGTMTDALVAVRPSMAHVGSDARPGVVHRLDAETSGAMVFAKTSAAYRALREAFESHARVRKTYLGVVRGAMPQPTGTLEAPIGRKAWDAKRMAVVTEGGANAVTHWRVLARRRGISLVEFTIDTGRTHQIRVHAAHLGCPIVGDALYGDPAADRRMGLRATRHLLHAVTLSFPHPVTGENVTFTVPPPPDFVYAVS